MLDLSLLNIEIGRSVGEKLSELPPFAFSALEIQNVGGAEEVDEKGLGECSGRARGFKASGAGSRMLRQVLGTCEALFRLFEESAAGP